MIRTVYREVTVVPKGSTIVLAIYKIDIDTLSIL